jgi:hypothetical protein
VRISTPQLRWSRVGQLPDFVKQSVVLFIQLFAQLLGSMPQPAWQVEMADLMGELQMASCHGFLQHDLMFMVAFVVEEYVLFDPIPVGPVLFCRNIVSDELFHGLYREVFWVLGS